MPIHPKHIVTGSGSGALDPTTAKLVDEERPLGRVETSGMASWKSSSFSSCFKK